MKKDFNKHKSKSFPNKKFDSFSKYSSSFSEMSAEKATIDKIDASQKGNTFLITGIVDQIAQTGGPTIISVSDGTGTLALKAFEGAGVRAYPEVNIKDAVTAVITIQEYNGDLEGEVESLKKLSDDEKNVMFENIAKMERKRAEVSDIDFLVKDQILDKLKERFMKAATEIRLAIIQNRPIIVRHHNDADGYSSGYSLERAILPLIVKQHNSVKSAWEFYTRAPISAPMYELDDSIRDTARSLSNAAKFSNKMPLVLIVDTGSGEKDLLGIRQGRVHGIDFIVVDHHAFDEDLISKEVLVHINPFLVNEDGTKYSAGMLCTELARFINNDPNLNIIQIPAMAGLADRIDNPKALEAYLKIAAEKGYTKEMLGEIAVVIDFISAKLRFMEAREYIEVLFGEPMEKQKSLVGLLTPYIQELESKGLTIAKTFSIETKINDITLQTLEIESSYARGFYPKPGKCISLLQEYAEKDKKISKVVTIGLMPDAMTFRASLESNFSMQIMVETLQKELPEAFIEGGGHKLAGSIRFIPGKSQEVLNSTKEYLKSLK